MRKASFNHYGDRPPVRRTNRAADEKIFRLFEDSFPMSKRFAGQSAATSTPFGACCSLALWHNQYGKMDIVGTKRLVVSSKTRLCDQKPAGHS